MQGHQGCQQSRRADQKVEYDPFTAPVTALEHEDGDADIAVKDGVEEEGEAAFPQGVEGAAAAGLSFR